MNVIAKVNRKLRKGGRGQVGTREVGWIGWHVSLGFSNCVNEIHEICFLYINKHLFLLKDSFHFHLIGTRLLSNIKGKVMFVDYPYLCFANVLIQNPKFIQMKEH